MVVLRDRLYYGQPTNQLTGIPKPPSPFRRIDVPNPQQQQQQQQYPSQRKASSNAPLHFRPQPTAEPSFVPPTNPSWTPSSSYIPTSDLNARATTGLMNQ